MKRHRPDEPTPAPEFVETAPEETAPEFVETAPEFVETAPEETAPAALTVAEAQCRLNASQNNYRAANDTVREKRAALGVALHRWLRLTDQAPPTAEENAREFIRQSNIERGLRATGQIPQRRHGSHGPSVIDQIASGTRGATYSNRSGAFAFKRGATTLAQSQAKLNAIQAEREMAAADPGGYPANALRRG